METKELKLSINQLKNYLGTGLNVIIEAEHLGTTIQENNVLKDFTDEIVFLKYLNGDFNKDVITKMTPCFRPISDLTKEIMVNGYKIIPAIEIAKYVDNGHNHTDSIVKKYTGSISVITDKCDDVENVSIHLDKSGISSIKRSGDNVYTRTYQRIFDCLIKYHFWLWDEEYFEKGLILKI